MSATLGLPEILPSLLDAPPPPAAPTATTAAIATLAGHDISAVALARFGDWRPQVAALAKRFANVVYDVRTPAGLRQLEAARAEVRKPRYAAQNVAKLAKSELAKVSKAIGAEETAIDLAVRAIEDPMTKQIDERNAELEREEQERINKDAARKAAHHAGITRLLSYITQAHDLPAERIAKGIALVEGMPVFGAEWEEFLAEAQETRTSVLRELQRMHAAAVASEAIAAELEQLRAEKAARDRESLVAAQLRAAEQARSERFNPERASPRFSDSIAITPNAQSGSCPADAPANASNEPEAAQGLPSGDEGPAAHAEERAADPAEPIEEASLKLGDIHAWLGFAITADFVRNTLKVQPAAAEKRAGHWFTPSQRELIRVRLLAHVAGLQ